MIISPDYDAGMHTRTVRTSGVTSPTTAPLFSSHPSAWTETGAAWTYDGDFATMVNSDDGDNYLSKIWNLAQGEAKAVTLRVKAKGTDIESPDSNDFSIHIYGSYAPAGVTNDVEDQVQFPSGTWEETQFTATITPVSPITYLYVYVFARNKTGTLRVRDLEVFEATGTDATHGEWVSDPIDLASYSQEPLPKGGQGLAPSHLCFYYGDLADVNNTKSVQHGKDTLSVFDMLVTHEPDLLDTKETEVMEYLRDTAEVQIFGYVATSSSDATIEAEMDRMDAAGYYGVFIDEAGYDWAVTRARFNSLVDYAHNLGLKVMANAWVPADVLDDLVNVTYNPSGVATNLTTDDWVLLESFYTRSDDTYAGDPEGGFIVSMDKYESAVSLADGLGVKIACLAYHRTSAAMDFTDDRDASFQLAVMLGLDAWAYGDTSSTNLEPFTTVPDLGVGSSISTALAQVNTDRFETKTDTVTLWLEFTDSPVARTYGQYRNAYRNVQLEVDTSQFDAERVTVIKETCSTRAGTWETLSVTARRYARARVVMTD